MNYRLAEVKDYSKTELTYNLIEPSVAPCY